MDHPDRLDRIEQKIDKLADAVVTLARMEERMITLFTRMDTYELRQTKIESKVEGIEREVHHSGFKVKFAERVFWILLTAAITGSFWFLDK